MTSTIPSTTLSSTRKGTDAVLSTQSLSSTTDLAPVPFRGKRNEPAFVARVVEGLAALRGAPVHEIVRQSTANFSAVIGRDRSSNAV